MIVQVIIALVAVAAAVLGIINGLKNVSVPPLPLLLTAACALWSHSLGSRLIDQDI